MVALVRSMQLNMLLLNKQLGSLMAKVICDYNTLPVPQGQARVAVEESDIQNEFRRRLTQAGLNRNQILIQLTHAAVSTAGITFSVQRTVNSMPFNATYSSELARGFWSTVPIVSVAAITGAALYIYMDNQNFEAELDAIINGEVEDVNIQELGAIVELAQAALNLAGGPAQIQAVINGIAAVLPVRSLLIGSALISGLSGAVAAATQEIETLPASGTPGQCATEDDLVAGFLNAWNIDWYAGGLQNYQAGQAEIAKEANKQCPVPHSRPSSTSTEPTS